MRNSIIYQRQDIHFKILVAQKSNICLIEKKVGSKIDEEGRKVYSQNELGAKISYFLFYAKVVKWQEGIVF